MTVDSLAGARRVGHGDFMATSEAARHELYTALSNAIGPPAETLLSQLLPIPGEELATKSELGELRAELSALRSELINRFDRMMIAQIGGFAALVIAVFLS